MISFNQFFHGYHGINTKLVRRRFHIQICACKNLHFADKTIIFSEHEVFEIVVMVHS
jgi:hypothetical protein